MSKIRVLLADDHRIVVEGLKCLLEPEFDLVDVVNNGEKLLEAAGRLRPDVIVSDISMPGLTGLDVLARVKVAHPAIRMVFLTMHHNVAYAREALQAGALGYVLKHSAVEELVMAVRAAMTGHVFVSPEIAGELLSGSRSDGRGKLDPFQRLSVRQREILRLLVDGCSAKVIAGRLDISPRTVESHKYKIMNTLDVTSNAELIRFAVQHGLAD